MRIVLTGVLAEPVPSYKRQTLFRLAQEPFYFIRFTSVGLIRSGAVQPSISYSAIH